MMLLQICRPRPTLMPEPLCTAGPATTGKRGPRPAHLQEHHRGAPWLGRTGQCSWSGRHLLVHAPARTPYRRGSGCRLTRRDVSVSLMLYRRLLCSRPWLGGVDGRGVACRPGDLGHRQQRAHRVSYVASRSLMLRRAYQSTWMNWTASPPPSAPVTLGRLPPLPVTSWLARASRPLTVPHPHALTLDKGGQSSTHGASLRPAGRSSVRFTSVRCADSSPVRRGCRSR